MTVKNLGTEQVLDIIAALASTPTERLQRKWVTDASISEADSQARLQRLYKLVGAENEEKEKHLLDQLQLSHEQIVRSLSLPGPIEITLLPAWVRTLEQILSCDHAASTPQSGTMADSADPCLQPESPVPYEELLLPFIRYARKQLLAYVPTRSSLLSQEAYGKLEHWLLELLISLAGQVLQNEFANFRTRHSHEDSLIEGSKSRNIYNAFLSQYEGRDLLKLFIEYSTLARLLVLRVEQWIEGCKEFLQRLEQDRKEIERYFRYDAPSLGQVVELQAGCSDPHHDGRSVFILTFSNERKLVYKPRSLHIDHAFFHLLTWINLRGPSPDLKGLHTLNRATHGWMEYTEHLPCKTQEEVQRYFQRAGQLVCLLYVLQASDMHYENIIASGEYPIPIDLETIVTPLYYTFLQDDPIPGSRIRNTLDYAVDRSTLLPIKLPIEGKVLDLSFLGCVSEFDSPQKSLFWKDINTDTMRLAYEAASLGVAKNAARLDGSVMKASDYLEDIITGFRNMYNLLTKHRDDLVAPWGPLVSFIGGPIRYLFRSTFIYEKLLARLVHPRFLRDGVDRWIEMQILKRPWLKKNADPRLWAIIEAEVSSLARLDIPRFVASPEGNDLSTNGEPPIENVFSRSALELVRECLVHLGVEDMERQVELIRDTFANAPVVPTEEKSA